MHIWISTTCSFGFMPTLFMQGSRSWEKHIKSQGYSKALSVGNCLSCLLVAFKKKKGSWQQWGGLSNWWQPVDSTSYSSFTTLCCAAGIYNHLFHWIGHFSFSNNRWQCAQAVSIKSDWTFSGSEELRYNLTKELRCNLTTDFILPERTPVSNCWKFDVSLILTILRTKWLMCRYQISWYQWRNLHIYENAKDVMISITLTAYW